MSAHPVYPLLDGSLNLPGLVDFNAHHNPHYPAFVYSEAPGSLTEISYFEFGRATHRAAHALRPGRAGQDGEIVAIIANVDTLLYTAIIVGTMRAGIVVSR
ncbi:hypothetical protein FIBSPDRAFT_721447 [Athelia psychrophila]|uniref:AMP-dependent synthetase/ligase domain-containing protein n=1 Tax=Athelia psychrophila TaxID=1759441 RepID=A0A166VTT9_9AGAM|nr:hypothetical protein FIBSPDRAFT_721335 [Fibularhizoctonia sp. CBS 109695]KZP33065.1 hypothetical protein FIBSPDRAFT_721447 [Fibularhizoctonia sp. CBS 109695]